MPDAPLASDLDEIVREAEGAVAAALDADAKQAAAKKAVVDAAGAITDRAQAAITKLYGYLQPGKPAPVLAIFFPTELPPVVEQPALPLEPPAAVEPPPAPVEPPPAPPAEPELVAEDDIVVAPPAPPEPEIVVEPPAAVEPVVEPTPAAEVAVDPQPTFPADPAVVQPAAPVAAPVVEEAAAADVATDPAANSGPVITPGVENNG